MPCKRSILLLAATLSVGLSCLSPHPLQAQQAPAQAQQAAPADSATPRLTRSEREELSRRLDERAGMAPAQPTSMGYGALLAQLLISLGAVCLLAYLAIRFGLKRFVPDQSAHAHMAVVARLPLEPRRTLLVVRVGGKHLVLASSEAGVQPVAELSEDEAAVFESAAPARKKTFSQVLQKSAAQAEEPQV